MVPVVAGRVVLVPQELVQLLQAVAVPQVEGLLQNTLINLASELVAPISVSVERILRSSCFFLSEKEPNCVDPVISSARIYKDH